jgi:DNA polymerase-1
MILVYGNDPRKIKMDSLVAIDTETTGLEWKDKLKGVSMAWKEADGIKSCYMVLEVEDQLFQPDGVILPNMIVSLVMANCRIVFHNMPFDYRVLYKAFGIEPAREMHDTMHLASIAEYQMSKSLENLYIKYLGEPPSWWVEVKHDRKNLSKMKESLVYEYAAFDAVATLMLFYVLYPKRDKGYDQDIQFSRLVMQLIQRGMPIDKQYILDKKQQFSTRMLAIQTELMKIGIKNPNSGDQVGKYVATIGGTATTKTGKMKVDEETLERFSTVRDVQLIIEYRQLSKAISSWFDDILEMAQDDGKVHAILNPFGTVSFRMSSSKINLQGIPMKTRKTAFGEKAFGNLNGMFISDRPGCKLWAIDIKQAEFRLACMLSRENTLATTFNTGSDPYTQMAIDTWQDMSRRQDAKRAALATIYETGIRTFAQTNKVSESEARAVLGAFREKYPNLKEASKFYEHKVIENSYVPLMDGRKRWFGPEDETYKAFNQRVQGSVAVAMWYIMLNVEKEFPGLMILQIHDSIILYLPDDEQQREVIITRIKEIIYNSVPEEIYNMVEPRVPFIADVELWQ